MHIIGKLNYCVVKGSTRKFDCLIPQKHTLMQTIYAAQVEAGLGWVTPPGKLIKTRIGLVSLTGFTLRKCHSMFRGMHLDTARDRAMPTCTAAEFQHVPY